MGFADRIKRVDVTNGKKLAYYCQQETGVPLPTGKQYALLYASIKEVFAMYPQANYQTLCSVVEWAKKKGFRYAHVGNLIKNGLRYAYQDGFLPELDPRNHPNNIENLILDALRVETNEYWIDRLILSTTPEAKEETYEEWLRYTESTDSAGNASTPT